MTFEDVRAIALELPGAVEAASRGTHSFTVRKKLFLRLMEDGRTLVLRTDWFERDHLITTAPAVFHLTSQIRDFPWVFVKLAAAEPAQLRALVQDAWRRAAPRRLVDAFDALP
ncbi:MAG TPA: MmcQ/YjbR family DNA-binding protein [Longimicrobium sp.]|jgi:hypothetical protein